MILTQTQVQFLDWIDSHPFVEKIYWTWGTALAYIYDHRLSTDLDFFSFDFLADYELLPLIADIKKHFSIEKVTRQNVYNRNIFLFDAHLDELKMEFTFFPFERQETWKIWKNKLAIDTPLEIWANKIHALTERHEVKDVYDIYYIMTRESIQLSELLMRCEEKFGTAFEPRDIIARMNYIARDLSYITPFLLPWSATTWEVQGWCEQMI
jgi:predicted nucleotidyltransferase component of viral defense system